LHLVIGAHAVDNVPVVLPKKPQILGTNSLLHPLLRLITVEVSGPSSARLTYWDINENAHVRLRKKSVNLVQEGSRHPVYKTVDAPRGDIAVKHDYPPLKLRKKRVCLFVPIHSHQALQYKLVHRVSHCRRALSAGRPFPVEMTGDGLTSQTLVIWKMLVESVLLLANKPLNQSLGLRALPSAVYSLNNDQRVFSKHCRLPGSRPHGR
jgi:hypothetical protein